MTRRALLKTATWAAAAPTARAQQASDPLAAARAQMAATPIEAIPLTNALTMLAGPGGNVVVLAGLDGKLIVDTFVRGAFEGLKQRIDAMGTTPLLYAIDTHWHFDHADNNESVHNAGAVIVAHENTKKRLSEAHELLGMHLNPAPAAALPSETFSQNHRLALDNEYVEMGYFSPAHTDTDIYVQFVLQDVLHAGDTFFNGMYPFIDASTGGNIRGMIAAADQAIKMTNPRTKIVPGHGPLADREALVKYRDMLVAVRDRVQKLKTAGRTGKEVLAAKPTSDFDAVWGKGFVQPDAFVASVYDAL